MEHRYEVPPEGAPDLTIGKWVEIFEAYGEAGGRGAIRVRSMRVGGKTLFFSRELGDQPGLRSLHPHEGEIIQISRGEGHIAFTLRH
jgi:hypothetical protein